MRAIYNLAYFFFALFYFPIFMVKIKQAENAKQLIAERFGKFDESWLKALADKKVICIHAVSVGEVMAIENFVKELLQRHSNIAVVLTTVTPTGQSIAKKIIAERLFTAYFPFDFSFCTRSFFNQIKPDCFLLVETELWPNAIAEALKQNIPVGVINGRLSERSITRYEKFSFFFKNVFRKINFIYAQTSDDAERFARLGVSKDFIIPLGNMKYDALLEPLQKSDRAYAVAGCWVAQNKKVLLAGSTHPGEEKMLLKAFSKIKSEFPDWIMVIAPRHIERTPELLDLIAPLELKVATTVGLKEKDFEVLIVNELGILKNLYEYADLVFIGGSLIEHGGQNPIEALRFKKAIMYGEHIENFKETYQKINEHNGGIILRQEDDLDRALHQLMKSEEECVQMGQRGYESLLSLSGATQKHLDALETMLCLNSECMKG